MPGKRESILLLFVLIVTNTDGARILAYFPTPSISHQVAFRPITQELAKRGHEVIVVTTDPVFPKGKAPANLTEIDVHDISYNNWDDIFLHHRGKKDELMLQVKLLFKRFGAIFDLQMQTPDVKTMLKDKDKKYFDILLLEACSRTLLGLAHKFDAPVILLSSFGAFPSQYHAFGAPTHPFLYPTPGRHRIYNLTLLEKVTEFVKLLALDYVIETTEDFDLEIMKKHFGGDVPNLEELTSRIQMLFLNEHPLWGDNHPVPPSILHIGGIHQAVEKDLPKDLKEYLDSSKHGVIYVSFGTNVLPSLLPPERIKIMTKVLSELPYDVLWKWDQDSLPGQSENIKIYKWFPQADLLRHPKVKLFVTQGGLQSTDEAIDAGVPLIGIPMLGDQWYNVEKYVRHGIGLQLDLITLSEKEFKDSVTTVIEDESYKNNMLRLKSLMRSHPVKPLDNAVWWIEHVMKYGGKHLQSPAVALSWVEYYEIKLVVVTLATVISILLLLVCIIKLICNFIYKIYKTKTKPKSH